GIGTKLVRKPRSTVDGLAGAGIGAHLAKSQAVGCLYVNGHASHGIDATRRAADSLPSAGFFARTGFDSPHQCLERVYRLSFPGKEASESFFNLSSLQHSSGSR